LVGKMQVNRGKGKVVMMLLNSHCQTQTPNDGNHIANADKNVSAICILADVLSKPA
jgi:hypothetical protein